MSFTAKIVSFILVLFIGGYFLCTKSIDADKQYINQRIQNVNGTVTNIELSQNKDLYTYSITYVNKDKVKKHAIYMTKLGLKEFDFIEN